LRIGGSGGGVVGEVFLQEEGSQFAGEATGAQFLLREGDRGLGLFGVEVEVEDSGGLL
jgi:hypothetical protein